MIKLNKNMILLTFKSICLFIPPHSCKKMHSLKTDLIVKILEVANIFSIWLSFKVSYVLFFSVFKKSCPNGKVRLRDTRIMSYLGRQLTSFAPYLSYLPSVYSIFIFNMLSNYPYSVSIYLWNFLKSIICSSSNLTTSGYITMIQPHLSSINN